MKNKILEVLYKNGRPISRRFNSEWLQHNEPELFNDILSNTSYLVECDISSRVHTVLKDIKEQPVCKTCGTPTTYPNTERTGFKTYCNSACMSKDPNLSAIMKVRKAKTDHDAANEKRKATTVEKYGVEFNSQRPEVKEILQKSKLEKSNPLALEKLMDRDWLNTQYNKNKRTALDISHEIFVDYTTVISYCEKFGFEIRAGGSSSQYEEKICRMLDSNEISYIRRTRKIISPYELDIYLPQFNFAIEVDGLYSHSFPNFERAKDKGYHLMKTNMCEKLGIHLMHFTCEQISTKWEIVESIILNKCKKSKMVYARKCNIIDVSPERATDFLNKNHIQGKLGSTIRLGLECDGELTSIMTFGKARYDDSEYELLRFCNKTGVSVVGGAGKLFACFIERHAPKSVMSFANKLWASGAMYAALGFVREKDTKIGYCWTDKTVTISRYKAMKHNLASWLPSYDDTKSEAENMFAAKYRRIWDCGQQVWKFSR
jgi:very-short-patch-repair endonuclease